MADDLRTITRFLRWVAPFWLVLLGLVLLSSSGLWLHQTPRFQGFSWGVTEMAHIYVGWVFLALFVGFLVHHLTRRWGSLRSLQRGLGLVLVAVTLGELVSGAALAAGRVGGYPGWVLTLHYLAMPAMLGFLVLHGLRPLLRWLRAKATPSSSLRSEEVTK
jgi:hypothetical protein